ncbi:MAG: porin family protein [Legionellaceae bacterium]|nr:porin family protein [Legionellaceae bacterium]
MKKFVLICAALSAILSNHLYAGTMSSDDNEPCWGPAEACLNTQQPDTHSQRNRIISFSIGPAWNRNGQSQTIVLQPTLQNRYVHITNNNVFPYGELFFGMQTPLKTLLGQFGIAVGAGGNAKLKGTIWQNANPALNTETYTYAVDEARIIAKGKVLVDIELYGIHPYVSGGLGASFNHPHAFKISPNNNGNATPYQFKSNVNTSFTYTLGAGFQEILNDHWQAGVGYEFANWGKTSLDHAPAQTINQGPLINNFYINSFLLNLTYVM